jgi:hypothetical protein
MKFPAQGGVLIIRNLKSYSGCVKLTAEPYLRELLLLFNIHNIVHNRKIEFAVTALWVNRLQARKIPKGR